MPVVTVKVQAARIDTPIPGALVQFGHTYGHQGQRGMQAYTDAQGMASFVVSDADLIALEQIPNVNSWLVYVHADGYVDTDTGFGFSVSLPRTDGVAITADLEPALASVPTPTPPVGGIPVSTPSPPVVMPPLEQAPPPYYDPTPVTPPPAPTPLPPTTTPLPSPTPLPPVVPVPPVSSLPVTTSAPPASNAGTPAPTAAATRGVPAVALLAGVGAAIWLAFKE